MEIVNNETGEIIEAETSEETMALARSEVNELAVFGKWLDAKEMLETAKEQFDMVDVPFRKAVTEIFDKYSIKSLKNSYIDIVAKNGYEKESWDSKALEKFIYQHGGDPDDFKKKSWVSGNLQIKYKG